MRYKTPVTIRERFEYAQQARRFEAWMREMNGGRAWEVNTMEQELEYDPMAFGGAQPNRMGFWLMSYVIDLRFNIDLALFVLGLRTADYIAHDFENGHQHGEY